MLEIYSRDLFYEKIYSMAALPTHTPSYIAMLWSSLAGPITFRKFIITWPECIQLPNFKFTTQTDIEQLLPIKACPWHDVNSIQGFARFFCRWVVQSCMIPPWMNPFSYRSYFYGIICMYFFHLYVYKIFSASDEWQAHMAHCDEARSQTLVATAFPKAMKEWHYSIWR